MKQTDKFREIHPKDFHSTQQNLVKVFQNYDFLVQVFEEFGHIRLTINRIEHTFQKQKPIWRDKILWDEILQIKQSIGYDEYWGLECFPPQEHFINLANMRHIFLFKEKPKFCWVKGNDN